MATGLSYRCFKKGTENTSIIKWLCVLGLVIAGCQARHDTSNDADTVSQKEGELRLGDSLTFWKKQQDEPHFSRFQITFERLFESNRYPPIVRDGPHCRLGVERAQDGKKYVYIGARVANLGPREATPLTPMAEKAEVQDENGFLYSAHWDGVDSDYVRLSGGLFGSVASIEAGKTGWVLCRAEVPQELKPRALLGTLGGCLTIHGHTRFRLVLPSVEPGARYKDIVVLKNTKLNAQEARPTKSRR